MTRPEIANVTTHLWPVKQRIGLQSDPEQTRRTTNMGFTILHNPRCSKSRNTLALLLNNGIEANVVEYLNTPPTPDQLQDILQKLGLAADAVTRKNETEYKEAAERFAAMDEAARIAWLCQNPKALERPIVITETAACIGRPPENVLELIKL